MGCAPSRVDSDGVVHPRPCSCLCNGCYPYLCCGGPLEGQTTTVYEEGAAVPLPEGTSQRKTRFFAVDLPPARPRPKRRAGSPPLLELALYALCIVSALWWAPLRLCGGSCITLHALAGS